MCWKCRGGSFSWVNRFSSCRHFLLQEGLPFPHVKAANVISCRLLGLNDSVNYCLLGAYVFEIVRRQWTKDMLVVVAGLGSGCPSGAGTTVASENPFVSWKTVATTGSENSGCWASCWNTCLIGEAFLHAHVRFSRSTFTWEPSMRPAPNQQRCGRPPGCCCPPSCM